jgi:hypothetical protein
MQLSAPETVRSSVRYRRFLLNSIFTRRRHITVPTRCGLDPSRPVVFTHIPKTSGTALSKVLTKALAPRHVVTGFDASVLGDFDALETIDETVRRLIFQPNTLPRDADLLIVHMAYSTTAAAYPDAQYLTIFREPSIRLLSHYLFWRGLPAAEIAQWGGWGERMRLSQGPLADFLFDERIACQTDNLALRMLLWPHDAIPRNGFISAVDDASLLAAANDRLSTYAYVGAVEAPGFRSDLARWLGQPIDYTNENVTLRMPVELRTDLAGLLTPEALSLLRMRTRLDDQLWRGAIGAGVDTEALRFNALLSVIARYGALMAGG